MTQPARAAAALVAVGFLAFHLPYLPASLEDLDSINFALGLRHYDVAQHQPHPPGYPVFIALGRVARYAVPAEAQTLGAIGVSSGALGVLAVFWLFREMDRAWPPSLACAAMLVAATSPLYWFTAARPLSDTTGLAAAVAVQAWTLAAATPASFAGAAFAAGLAAGLRSQVVWLTVPLLVFVALRRERRGARLRFLEASWAWAWPFALGCLTWAIPLLALNGGPIGYWHALFSQGAEDLSGIQMLWTTPTPRVLVSSLYFAFVAPWALWSVAFVVLVFSTVGAVLLFRYGRRAATTLAVAFVPYILFDVVFQETFTTRYALPIVVPMSYLAVRGAAAFGWRAGVAVAVVLSIYDAHVGGTSIAAYAREKAPAFRMLADMRRAAPPSAVPPILAMDRREQLDLRRPITWVGDGMPRVAQQLPSPPQHEWLEMVKYWNQDRTSPIWYVADPLRTDIDLVQHGDPIAYRWSIPYPVLLGGIRPNGMDWYRIEQPDWYVGPGWSLTPEATGVSQLDHRGLSIGPIEGWVRRSVLDGGAIVFGGRNLDPRALPHVTVSLGSWKWRDFTLAPGFFLEVARLPVVGLDAPAGGYVRMTVTADPPAPVAIEQFDATSAPARRPVFGFGHGWNEQEYNPATGKRWRWLSERGEIQVMGTRQPIRLHLEGESPRTYFSRPSRLTVRVGNAVAFDDILSDDFSIDVTIPRELVADPSGRTTIVLETDQVYVPAERSSRTGDRRHLGLRIFKCELRPLAR